MIRIRSQVAIKNLRSNKCESTINLKHLLTKLHSVSNSEIETMKLFFILSLIGFRIISAIDLLNNDWNTLNEHVTFKLFTSPSDQEDFNKMWEEGLDIACTVNNENDVNVEPPPSLNPKLPVKLLTHGFQDTVISNKLLFVPAWMERYNNQVNVILLDWSHLARGPPTAYNDRARNAIDVGKYTGLCLSNLGISGDQFHLLGHSLGAHLVGNAGKVFEEKTGQKMARITALDPAGPRFWNGPALYALEELENNRLNRHVAHFVDAIHTDGSAYPCTVCPEPHFGTMYAVADLDFYPHGGYGQPGCSIGNINGGVACSHGRAVTYYLSTINNENVYPSVPCRIRFSLSDVLNLASANLDPTPCRQTGDSEIYLLGESAETSFRNNNEKNTKLYTHVEQSFAESIWCNVCSWCC